jgi:indole-3-glycerol phosphate synthase
MAEDADVLLAAAAGADAVLIGTALSMTAEPEVLLARLGNVPRHARQG